MCSCLVHRSQGLIRRFKHVMEERLAHPEKYDPEQYFQRAWSGESFVNEKWAAAHGDGKIWLQGQQGGGGSAR
jgi:hypothetical protein